MGWLVKDFLDTLDRLQRHVTQITCDDEVLEPLLLRRDVELHTRLLWRELRRTVQPYLTLPFYYTGIRVLAYVGTATQVYHSP